MSERYVIGIDTGGNKTVGLLADESGNIVTKARGEGANLVVHGELAVEKVLYQLIEGLGSPGPTAAICLGMAGLERPDDEELIQGVRRRSIWLAPAGPCLGSSSLPSPIRLSKQGVSSKPVPVSSGVSKASRRKAPSPLPSSCSTNEDP